VRMARTLLGLGVHPQAAATGLAPLHASVTLDASGSIEVERRVA
jgi:hypothetical protein